MKKWNGKEWKKMEWDGNKYWMKEMEWNRIEKVDEMEWEEKKRNGMEWKEALNEKWNRMKK